MKKKKQTQKEPDTVRTERISNTDNGSTLRVRVVGNKKKYDRSKETTGWKQDLN
jgi:hypothetical protein